MALSAYKKNVEKRSALLLEMMGSKAPEDFAGEYRFLMLILVELRSPFTLYCHQKHSLVSTLPRLVGGLFGMQGVLSRRNGIQLTG